jgi:hypothetical protein
MRGLNLTDKMMYWELRRTWQVLKMYSLDKKILHPLVTALEKANLNREK